MARAKGRGARRDLAKAAKLFAQAFEQERSGEPERAERGYRRVLALQPDHPGALHQLAFLIRGAGKLQPALLLLRRAVAAMPRDAVMRNNLGNLLREAGQLDEAAAEYRAALRLDPDYVNAAFNLGQTLQSNGDAAGALPCLERVIALRPNDTGARAARAGVLLDLGRASEAVNAAREALAIDPKDARAHNELGLACTDTGDFESAAAALRTALRLGSGSVKAFLNLVRIQRYQSTEHEDIRFGERLLESASIDPAERAELHFALGKVYDDCEHYREAFAHFREANRLVRATRLYDRAAQARAADRLIETFSPALFERLGNAGADSSLPVLVVGMPRSGTSLVEQIIASHPRAAGAGELATLARLGAALAERSDGETPYPECVARLDARTAGALGEEYLDELRARGGNDGLRISDKMPTNFWHLGLAAVLLPRARVVHCRRDPRDVAVSIYFRQFTYGHGYAYDLDDIAWEQRLHDRLMAHWNAVLPLPIHEVCYEELVSDQERVTRELIAFLALPWDPRCLRFHTTERAVHTASAWQVRQPVYTRSVGRWRHYAEFLEGKGGAAV